MLIGSGAGAAEEAVAALNGSGAKVGLVKVRLYRPFSGEAFVASLPATVRSLAVLDRTKEPGAPGEPLYQDVVTALAEEVAAGCHLERMPRVIGGRYGLSSKQFTPAMAAGIYAELARDEPRNHFTIGIVDDVSGTSLPYDPSFTTGASDAIRAVFYGLGSDGTVGANHNSARIIGERAGLHSQAYFVYDSRKAGARTVSHLRFAPRPIASTYLIERAGFVACHQFEFLDQVDVLELAEAGATFLLNSPHGPDEVWDQLPAEVQEQIIEKEVELHVVDGHRVAREAGLGGRINTVLQTCFFALSGLLPLEDALAAIKDSITATYAKYGQPVLERNFAAVDGALAALHRVEVPAAPSATRRLPPPVPPEAPEFVQRVTAMMIAGKGDLLPVSAMPVDGTFPTGTSRWERRSLAKEIPIWDPEICIDCGKCTIVCPHAAIRMKVFAEEALDGAPRGFKAKPFRSKEHPDTLLAIQVAPEDCTGCGVCVDVLPRALEGDRPAQVDQHEAEAGSPRAGAGALRRSSSGSPSSIARRCRSTRSRARRCSSRCSSSRAPARAAARRRT